VRRPQRLDQRFARQQPPGPGRRALQQLLHRTGAHAEEAAEVAIVLEVSLVHLRGAQAAERDVAERRGHELPCTVVRPCATARHSARTSRTGAIDAIEPVGVGRLEALHHAAALVDQGAEAAAIEGGREILHLAALRADAGQQQPGVRQQRPQPRQFLRPGGADHGPHRRVTVRHRQVLPPARHGAGDDVAQRFATHRQVLEVLGAGVAGAHQDEHPAAATLGPAVAQERLHRVEAEVGMQRHGVGDTEVALGVGLGGASRCRRA
jgi:hypothetical protein